MTRSIVVSPSVLMGDIVAPASKSDAQRAIVAAALANGTSTLHGYDPCADTESALVAAGAMGAAIDRGGTIIRITGGSDAFPSLITCGESGLLFRLLAPIAAVRERATTLTASGTLTRRSIRQTEESLRMLSVRCDSASGFPPLTVHGPLVAGSATIDGSGGSQHISGLLFALAMAKGDSHLKIANATSMPYLQMTVNMLEAFGVKIDHSETLDNFEIRGGQEFQHVDRTIEADWSGAAAIFIAGAITGKLTLRGLSNASVQADRAILRILEDAGAKVRIDHQSITVERSDLKSFEADARHTPDLVPSLVVLAACAEGKSRITNIGRLANKESDRAKGLAAEFAKIGVNAQIVGNVLEVVGGPIAGGEIDPHGDHRLAMAGALAGLRSVAGVRVTGADCAAKSYPRFYSDLEMCGAVVERVEILPRRHEGGKQV